MVDERHPLTPEKVIRAERNTETSHPVLSVIETHLPRIGELNTHYKQISDPSEQQKFIREQYGFLADGFVDSNPYTLNSEDIITIWSQATKIFSSYHRRALMGMISSAYAVQGLEDSKWKKFPRAYFETSQIPEELKQDRKGLEHIQGRLEDIHTSRLRIRDYIFDLDKNYPELHEVFIVPEGTGIRLLNDVKDSFGGGFSPLVFWVGNAIRSLPGEPTRNNFSGYFEKT